MTIPSIDERTLSTARSLVAQMRAAFDAAVLSVARCSAPQGKLDAGALDRHQWVCFDLAAGEAELSAAQALLDGAPSANPLDRALALAFAVPAIDAVAARLQAVYAATDLDPAPLRAIVSGDALLALRREAGVATFLERVGAAVIDSTIELADVPLDEQSSMARDAFRDFARDVVAPVAEDIHRNDLTVPEDLLQPMREMGVFGLSIPEEFGGSAPRGAGNTAMMIAVTEALSEASLAAAGSLTTRPEILARALMAGGTDAQKSQWLPRLAAGDPLCAIAITEPDYGSDVASLALRGTRVDGGWRLTGAKTWCTLAGKAGVLMVVTRTNPDRSLGHRGLSLLLVEKPSHDGHEFVVEQPGRGKLHGRAIPTIGYRGMHSFDLAFEDFFVPDDNVIGGEGGVGRGFYLTMAGMVGGRIQTAGRALGVMRAAIRAAVRYAGDRRVFGAPLADYQLTRVKIALMAARFAACRFLAYSVAQQLDGHADGGAGAMQASLVKLIACRSAETVTREAQQIHGGMGYAEETAVSRYFVDARVLSIFEGAEETLALKVIARSLLESALASSRAASRAASPGSPTPASTQ